MFTHIYIHTDIHTYIHAYIRTWVHTYVRACIHTYIHSTDKFVSMPLVFFWWVWVFGFGVLRLGVSLCALWVGGTGWGVSKFESLGPSGLRAQNRGFSVDPGLKTLNTESSTHRVWGLGMLGLRALSLSHFDSHSVCGSWFQVCSLGLRSSRVLSVDTGGLL